MSSEASRCVPITMSMRPAASPSTMSRCSRGLQKRLSRAMSNGNSAMRSRKVWKCCSARIVVGTSTATWYPLSTALNAARMATSVLPKPTSPHRSRSMGRGWRMSRLMASMDASWSTVSSYGNDVSNSCCHSESSANAIPGRAWRAAWISSISEARSTTAASAAAFCRTHVLPPMRASAGRLLVPPTYF